MIDSTGEMEMTDMTATEVGARQSQMSQEIESLNSIATSISESIKNLDKRLSPYLTSETPNEQKDVGAEDSLVPQANKIRGIRGVLDEALNSLNSIQQRLEV